MPKFALPGLKLPSLKEIFKPRQLVILGSILGVSLIAILGKNLLRPGQKISPTLIPPLPTATESSDGFYNPLTDEFIPYDNTTGLEGIYDPDLGTYQTEESLSAGAGSSDSNCKVATVGEDGIPSLYSAYIKLVGKNPDHITDTPRIGLSHAGVGAGVTGLFSCDEDVIDPPNGCKKLRPGDLLDRVYQKGASLALCP